MRGISTEKFLQKMGEEYHPFIFFVDVLTFYINESNLKVTYDVSNGKFIENNCYIKHDNISYKMCYALPYTLNSININDLISSLKGMIDKNIFLYVYKDTFDNVIYEYDSKFGIGIFFYKSPESDRYFRKIKMDKIFDDV